MSRNTSITLGDHFADFVDRQVTSGRYSSASDVVPASLRLLEEEVASRFEALRGRAGKGLTTDEIMALTRGEPSG
jgi:antitoxin ParD1/3/4